MLSVEFGEMDPVVAARLVAAAADIAIMVNRDGIVQSVSFGGEGRLSEQLHPWRGRRWIDVVAPDSRAKALDLVSEAAQGKPGRPREINHPGLQSSETVPIRYSAFKGGAEGAVYVVGRDLRAVAELEVRLSATQQAIEQEYARLRATDTRYRLLFHLTREPVIIADAASRRIVEANPAALAALGVQGRVVGRGILQLFDGPSVTLLSGAMSQATSTGEASATDLMTVDGRGPLSVTLSLFRQDGGAFVLVRIDMAPSAESSAAAGPLAEIIDRAPDAIVATDTSGIVLEANAAFIELAQLATLDQVRGQPLDRWVGRSGVDYSTLSSMLGEYGSVRGFTTVMRGIYGTTTDVDVSAVSVSAPIACAGFIIRPVARQRERESLLKASMPRSVEQLTQLVGRVPLKELVRETTDIIERLCIEAALSMTGDNRASAAEMLGLSRQSLYAKLHRFGLGDLAGGDTEN